MGHGFTGVHPHQLAVSFDHTGVRLREMARVEFGNRTLVAGAVGIEPRVQLKAPTVRGGDPLAQRIVERLGRAALFPGEKLRPRLERRRIDRIGGRAHLKHDRVEAQGLRAVENGEHLGTLLHRGQTGFAGPIDVGDGRDPDAAKFARRRRRHIGGIHGRDGRRCRRGRRIRGGAAGEKPDEQERKESTMGESRLHQKHHERLSARRTSPATESSAACAATTSVFRRSATIAVLTL